ncbi:N-acetylmuramoyl-L-alanine amidase [Lysinibacillus sp. 54212]|uniref:N-acetylmuramoyl-L-alanine amidase n=1 Tax=Lysinibacillus sp. 54212 TaxID=3119829 RepID=UPI002FCAEA88
MNKILIALDDGHGTETPGKRTPYISEIGRHIKENEFNKHVVNLLAAELTRCGFGVLLVAPTDADTPLAVRVKKANDAGADAYVAIHYDGFDGKFDGYDPEGNTVFYSTGSTKGKKLAECIGEFLKQGTTQRWRGVKSANYYVLKHTKMPAILSENGFMDNKREALLMIDMTFQLEVAQEHAKGICKYFGVKYVAAGTQKPLTNKPATATPNAVMGTVKVIVDKLNYYDGPRWTKPVGTVRKDTILTVVGKELVEGVYQYKLKSGTYITASPKFVKFTAK